MSHFHSPSIVSDRLVACLDTFNKKSYSGSGSTWVDLSTSNNNFNIVNSPAFINETLFSFTGNNYAVSPLNLYNQDNSIFSFSLWFKISNPGVIMHQTIAANNGTNGGWVPAVYVTSLNKLRVTGFWGVGTSGGYSDPSDIIFNKWYNVTHTFDSNNNRRVYIDGNLVSTINGSQNSYSSTYYIILGSGNANNWPGDPASGMIGNLNNFLFYRKALSDAEVLQNYNALKGRYGL